MDKINRTEAVKKAMWINVVAIFILNVIVYRQPSAQVWMWIVALWTLYFVLNVLLFLKWSDTVRSDVRTVSTG